MALVGLAWVTLGVSFKKLTIGRGIAAANTLRICSTNSDLGNTYKLSGWVHPQSITTLSTEVKRRHV